MNLNSSSIDLNLQHSISFFRYLFSARFLFYVAVILSLDFALHLIVGFIKTEYTISIYLLISLGSVIAPDYPTELLYVWAITVVRARYHGLTFAILMVRAFDAVLGYPATL